MKNDYELSSLLMVIYSFHLLLLLHSIPQGASRKLEQLCPQVEASPPSPTPVNTVGYHSETRNGSYAGVVCVNGKPRSQSGTVHDPNGTPQIEGKQHNGSSNGNINDPSGKPTIRGSSTPDAQTAIINGINGKPRFEVYRYSNGTSIIYILDDNGKPLYQINNLPPPGSEGSGATNFGGYSSTPTTLENPVSPPAN